MSFERTTILSIFSEWQPYYSIVDSDCIQYVEKQYIAIYKVLQLC